MECAQKHNLGRQKKICPFCGLTFFRAGNANPRNDRLWAMRILLLNLGGDSLGEVNKSLEGQGYEIATENGLNVDQVLVLAPEMLITEATPSDLGCCGLTTQPKPRADTKPLKIVMVIHGGALERARALDLGADDVISFPFESIEFTARIRTQFRERQSEEDLQTMLKYAVQRENI